MFEYDYRQYWAFLENESFIKPNGVSVGENNIVYHDGKISGSVKLNVINNSGIPTNATAVAAVFEKDTNSFKGICVGVGTPIGAGNTEVIAKLPEIADASGDYIAKVYLWYGEDKIYPVSKVICIDIFENVPILTQSREIPETENGVYKIENANQLAWFSKLISGTASDENGEMIEAQPSANAILLNDIYINNPIASDGSFDEKWYETDFSAENWYSTAIGRIDETLGGNAFSGTFDGNGKTVYGLFVKGSYMAGGLFATVSGGTVKNININSAYIVSTHKSTRYGSGATAVAVGELKNGTVSTVTASGKMACDGENTSSHLAGSIVALVSGDQRVSEVKDCASFADIDFSISAAHATDASYNPDGVSGIIGSVKTSTDKKCVIKNNTFCGSIDATKSRYAAGIVAWAQASTHIGTLSGNANYATIRGGKSHCAQILASYGSDTDASGKYFSENLCEGIIIPLSIETTK